MGESYREKWLWTLQTYNEWVRKNKPSRDKLTTAAMKEEPAELTDEEVRSFVEEQKALDAFLELVRNPS